MKAIEYYEKFGEQILREFESNKEVDGIVDLVIAFKREMKELMKERHVQTDQGVIAVIRELNQKWNALCNLFRKKNGFTPIVYNGFSMFLQKEIPELKQRMKELGGCDHVL